MIVFCVKPSLCVQCDCREVCFTTAPWHSGWYADVEMVAVSLCVCVCSIGASLHIYRTSLESLDLRSLTSIRNGGVLIKSNPRLCYVDNMHWELIQSSAEQKLLVAGNANASQCGVCLSMIDCWLLTAGASAFLGRVDWTWCSGQWSFCNSLICVALKPPA